MMNIRNIACWVWLLVGSAVAADKPNILFILADDFGYGDLGCYNPESKVPTPNLDRLAVGGTRFTDAYCPVSVCSPTRYALMAGRYPCRSWKKNGVLANWQGPMIEEGRLTLPGMLRQAGYTTAGFGKWHLGANYTTTDGKPPLGQGKFEGADNGANIDLKAPIHGGPLDRGFDTWFGFVCASENAIFDGNRAVCLLEHPLHETSPALKQQGLPTMEIRDYLPLVTGKTLAWLEQQKPEQPFFLYVAPYVPHIPLALEEKFRGTSKGGDYGDYVHELDHYLGQILGALDRKGLASNTLVIFASDNGSQWTTTGDDHHPNGSLRGTKYTPYEGGVRTPLIVRWPGHVPAARSCPQLIALNDVLATCAALTGQQLPRGAGEDSLNQLPLLLGAAESPIREEVLIQSSKGEFGLRHGQWKLIAAGGKQPAALYDLAKDLGETTNVADKYPVIVEEMSAKLSQILGQEARPAKPASGR